MPRYDDYDSDDSTLVDDRRRQRRARYHSASEDSYYDRRSYRGSERTEAEPEYGRDSERSNFGKTTLAIGVLTVVAGFIHLWSMKKNAEREKEDQRRRRKKFEKAKAERRRNEETREAQWYRSDKREADGEVKRIGYRPTRSRSRSRAPRRIEAPPGSRPVSRDPSRARDEGHENDRQSRRD